MNPRLTFNRIIEYVSEFYDVPIEKILSPRRKKELVRARQTIIYLAREKLGKSYPAIGRKLGKRDHTTILYTYRKIKDDLERNEDIKRDINSILNTLERDTEIKKQREKISLIIEKENRKKPLGILKSLEELPKQFISQENLQRQKIIIQKYNEGYTLSKIGEEYKLTRERVRQIIQKGYFNEATEIIKQGFAVDFDEFFKEKKKEHLEAMKQKIEGFEKKIAKPPKEIRWSKYYDYCRKCGTTIIKHHSHGYCRKCYPKTDTFKEIQESSRLRNIEKRKKWEKEYSHNYNRRAEVIERRRKKEDLKYFSGNREKAIRASNNCCAVCEISRNDCQLKYNRDLYVVHINGNKKDNLFGNLIVLCRGCFQKKVSQRKQELKK